MDAQSIRWSHTCTQPTAKIDTRSCLRITRTYYHHEFNQELGWVNRCLYVIWFVYNSILSNQLSGFWQMFHNIQTWRVSGMLYTTLYIHITLNMDHPYHKNNLKTNKITKELTGGAMHFIISTWMILTLNCGWQIMQLSVHYASMVTNFQS